MFDSTEVTNKKQDPLRSQERLWRQDKKYDDDLPYADLTGSILACCFEVMKELGIGFLESVYKNALVIALKQQGHGVQIEKSFEVYFQQRKVGLYKADIVVEETVIIEAKCCKSLLPEHQAQTINYLAAAKLPVGLLVNFRHRNLEYRRVRCPFDPAAAGVHASVADPVFLPEAQDLS